MAIIGVALVATMGGVGLANASPSTSRTVNELSWELSRSRWDAGQARRAVIAEADDISAAAFSVPFVGVYGPLLLTSADDGSPVLQEAMRAVRPPEDCELPNIVIAADKHTFPSELEDQLRAAGHCPLRLDPSAPRAASGEVARFAVGNDPDAASTVLLANDEDPSVLAHVAGYGAALGRPIVLTDGDDLSSSARDFLRWARPNRVVMLGGPDVFDEGVLEEARASLSPTAPTGRETPGSEEQPSTEDGWMMPSGRPSSAASVSEHAWITLGAQTVTVVDSGQPGGEALALLASAEAAHDPSIVLPVDGDRVPEGTRTALARLSGPTLKTLGKVNEQARATATELLQRPPELTGEEVDDYEESGFDDYGLQGAVRWIQRGVEIDVGREMTCHWSTEVSVSVTEVATFSNRVVLPVQVDHSRCLRVVEFGSRTLKETTEQSIGLTGSEAYTASGGRGQFDLAEPEPNTGHRPIATAWSYSHVDELARWLPVPTLPGTELVQQHIRPTSEATAKVYYYYPNDGIGRQCIDGTYAAYWATWRVLQLDTPALKTRWEMTESIYDGYISCNTVWAKHHFETENREFNLCPFHGPNVVANHWPTYVEVNVVGMHFSPPVALPNWTFNTTHTNGRCSFLLRDTDEARYGRQTAGYNFQACSGTDVEIPGICGSPPPTG